MPLPLFSVYFGNKVSFFFHRTAWTMIFWFYATPTVTGMTCVTISSIFHFLWGLPNVFAWAGFKPWFY
jgi:hypothetical protein